MEDQYSFFSDDNYFTIDEAAEVLGITQASIRNWIRHGYLKPAAGLSRMYFKKSDIDEIKNNIKSGKVERLNKRANKSRATKTFIPEEYFSNKEITELIQKIIIRIVKYQLEISPSLFYLTVNLLEKHTLLKFELDEKSGSLSVEVLNDSIGGELNNWKQSLSENFRPETYGQLLFMNIPLQEDILGLIYQSVLAEGSKSRIGSYYTPSNTVDSIITDHYKPHHLFLDPCCGTGAFLLRAAALTDKPENIYGFDSDSIAIRIARINLLLKYIDQQFTPKVYCYDTLNGLPSGFDHKFDFIASNPPWGMHLNREQMKSLKINYPEISSGESFSYFIRKGFDLLKEGGTLSFILPEAILNVRTHKDIREFILRNTRINSIHLFDRMFKNVFTKVIRLDVNKSSKLIEDNQIRVIQDTNLYYSSQADLYKDAVYTFSFHLDRHSENIIKKCYTPYYTTLKNHADWALGIVTGDNKKYILSHHEAGYEEVITGKEIDKYRLKDVCKFIKFQPELFQQVAPIKKYRAKEKLIYKFISRSLVVAYDDKQRLTLNSANILIPEVPNYPIKSILALLNSSLYQFIFQQKYNSIKVLRSHLEELPLPILDKEVHSKIDNLVESILGGEENMEELDNYIFNLFCLNSIEINYLKGYKQK